MKLDRDLRRTIKNEAKLCILANLPRCVIAAVAYLLPSLCVAMLTAVPVDAGLPEIVRMLAINFVCEVVLLGPIMLCMQYYFVQASRRRALPLQELFAPLGEVRQVLRGIRMMLCLVVRMLLLAAIPTVLYEAASYFVLSWMGKQGIQDETMILSAIGVLTFVYFLLLLPAAGRLISYWMGYAALYDQPELGVWRATRQTSRMLRGQRRQMIAFAVSFLPWFIGGMFTCGLLACFGMIYLSVSLFRLHDRLAADTDQQAPPEEPMV